MGNPSRIRFISVVTLLWTCLFVCATAHAQAGQNPVTGQANTPPTMPAGPPSQITGHIYRADNNLPIARALVILVPIGIPDVEQSTRTDAEGAYTFARLNPGNYNVRAEHAGFISQAAVNNPSAAMLSVRSGQTLSQIDIRLLSSGVISGTVFDEDNQPIEGAQVAAIRMRYALGGAQQEVPVRNVASDDLGNFRLFGLAPGSYFVRVVNMNGNPTIGDQGFRAAYYPGTPTLESAQRVKVTAGSETSGIRFSVASQALYSIAGSITDSTESGDPKRYMVVAIPVGRNGGVGSAQSTSQVTDGSFMIRGVPSGEYMLNATGIQIGPNAQNAGQQRRDVGTAMVRVSDGDVRANIQIAKSAEVEGKIIIENSTGQSISGKRITLQTQMQGPGLGGNVFASTTDQNGMFKISNVQNGAFAFSAAGGNDIYLKQVLCAGRDYTIQPLTIESGVGPSDCVLTMGTDAGIMKGHVLDANQPAPNLVVIAIPQSRPLRQLARYTVTGNTNANGEFQIAGMIPGDYMVFAVQRDDEQSYYQIDFADRLQEFAERVSVKSGETKSIQLKPITLQ